jgi:hypothetical protein
MKPTIHLTNWSSRKLHGPGRKYTIMAAPRRWERGDGRVAALVPNPRMLGDYQEGLVELSTYRAMFERALVQDLEAGLLAPGTLRWTGPYPTGGPIEDGDTLCCACSRDEAAAGRCHRAWAAPYLARAGWRVILDGAEVDP